MCGIVASGRLCWYETVGSDHGQLFAVDSMDLTGDGVDELIACAWDGTTYIFDRQCDCVVHDFDANVLAFAACKLTVSQPSCSSLESPAPNLSNSVGQYMGIQPCLIYATNDAVTVFVMGSSTQEADNKATLELLGSASVASKTAVIHDPGRPICYVRPPSLEEALRYRTPDLPERARALAQWSVHKRESTTTESGSERGSGAEEAAVVLQNFVYSCLFMVDGACEEPVEVLKVAEETDRGLPREVNSSSHRPHLNITHTLKITESFMFTIVKAINISDRKH